MHYHLSAAQQRQEPSPELFVLDAEQQRRRAVEAAERTVIESHDPTASAPVQRFRLEQSPARASDPGRRGQVIALVRLDARLCRSTAKAIELARSTDELDIPA